MSSSYLGYKTTTPNPTAITTAGVRQSTAVGSRRLRCTSSYAIWTNSPGFMTRCFLQIYRVITSVKMARNTGPLIELFCLLVTTFNLWSGANQWSMDGSLMLLPNRNILVDRPRFIKALIVVLNNSEYGERYRRRDNAIRRDLLNVNNNTKTQVTFSDSL